MRSAAAASRRGAAVVFLAAGLAGLIPACAGGGGEPPPPPPGAIPAGQAIGSARLTGRVLFRGAAPARRPIKMGGEAACRHSGEGALSEDLVVSAGGGLKNALVRVVAGLGDRVFAPPAEPAVMDQKGCVFLPHLLVAQVNQPIEFRNSDPVSHNVRAVARANRPFNVSMARQGRSFRRHFGAPEVVKIRCDIHAWMGAFVAVESHPFFAVTSDDGSFTIAGLPAGEYAVEAWHETLGAARQTVTLGEGEERSLEFAFARP